MTLAARFALYSLAGTISLMSLLVLPAMVGVLVDESPLSEFQAGWAVSAGFLGSAAVALFMAFHMHGLNLRRTAMLAFAFAALGDAMSGFVAHQPFFFIAARVLTGIAGGAAYTTILAAFARERHVDRGYGMFITLQFIISGLGLYLLPVYSAWLSVTGMYLAFAALDVAGLVFCYWMPAKALWEPPGKSQKNELGVLLTGAVIFGTLGFALFEAANTAQFTYLERFGVSLSLTDHEIGLAMLVGSLCGIPGAFAIVLTGSRFGRTGPITLGVVIALVGLWILINAEQFSGVLAGSMLMGFSWAFCLPFIQGLLASLDPHGSAVAAGSAMSTLGGSLAPGLAALIVANESYRGVFHLSGLLFVAALLSFYLVRRRKYG